MILVAGMLTATLLCLLWVLVSLPPCLPQAIITLVDTNYVVQEGRQVSINIKKTGTAASPVNVVVMVGTSYHLIYGSF